MPGVGITEGELSLLFSLAALLIASIALAWLILQNCCGYHGMERHVTRVAGASNGAAYAALANGVGGAPSNAAVAEVASSPAATESQGDAPLTSDTLALGAPEISNAQHSAAASVTAGPAEGGPAAHDHAVARLQEVQLQLQEAEFAVETLKLRTQQASTGQVLSSPAARRHAASQHQPRAALGPQRPVHEQLLEATTRLIETELATDEWRAKAEAAEERLRMTRGQHG